MRQNAIAGILAQKLRLIHTERLSKMHYSERAIELLEAVIEADKTLTLVKTDTVHTPQKLRLATNHYRESVAAFIRQVTTDYEKTQANEIEMEHMAKIRGGKPRPPKGIRSF